jgi:biotin operon repressor
MSKTARLQKALEKNKLSINQIASRFDISNVSAFINDIRRKGVDVKTTATKSGITAYFI